LPTVGGKKAPDSGAELRAGGFEQAVGSVGEAGRVLEEALTHVPAVRKCQHAGTGQATAFLAWNVSMFTMAV